MDVTVKAPVASIGIQTQNTHTVLASGTPPTLHADRAGAFTVANILVARGGASPRAPGALENSKVMLTTRVYPGCLHSRGRRICGVMS